ncbi:hypothetical protein [Chitinophaga sp. 22620]|uniref:hypothetical protein n=1 Tax=Chitinophaga sp. 22620 TaxID=3453952 RepID=UPI003F832600
MIGVFWIMMAVVWVFIIIVAVKNRRRGNGYDTDPGVPADHAHFNATHHQPPAGFDGHDGGSGGGGGAEGGWSDSGGDSGGGDSGGGDSGGGDGGGGSD